MDLPSLKNRIKDRFTTDWRKIDWPRTGLLILLILAVYAAGWQYVMPQVRTVTTKEFKRVPEIKTVHDVKRVYVSCPEQGLVALDKKEVAEKLDLPWLTGGNIEAAVTGEVIPPSTEGTQSPVAGSPNDLQVTATADLPDSKNGYQVIAVVNTQTGITTPVVKEKDSPWFRLENHGSLGLWYGYNLHLQQAAQGDLTWKFLRIKDMHLGLKADGATDGSGHTMLGILYEW